MTNSRNKTTEPVAPKLAHHEIERLMADLILPFHHIKRDITLPRGERRHENDAEHSWSLAFLAMCLAPVIDSELDTARVCQIATVHDIVEVFADDTSTFADATKQATKVEREQQALAKIQHDFPHFPGIVAVSLEYKELASPEARFVYALDKYVTVLFDYLDEGRYLKDIKMTHKRYVEHLTRHREKAQVHPTVGAYYDQVRRLLDEHPEYFYRDNDSGGPA
jgi:putative hydrolase of HD superfamily